MIIARKTYEGTVTLSQDNNQLEYRLIKKGNAGLENFRVNYVLSKYYSEDKKVKVTIMHNNDRKFYAVGKLYKNVVYGNYEWFVDDAMNYESRCIGDTLFDLTGEYVRLIIEYN
jgi:hypothetical protein